MRPDGPDLTLLLSLQAPCGTPWPQIRASIPTLPGPDCAVAYLAARELKLFQVAGPNVATLTRIYPTLTILDRVEATFLRTLRKEMPQCRGERQMVLLCEVLGMAIECRVRGFRRTGKDYPS